MNALVLVKHRLAQGLQQGRVEQEQRGTAELFASPQHPYTEALLSSIRQPDPLAARNRIVLEGEVPSPVNPPSGCRFRTRCPLAADICAEQRPVFREVAPDHYVACHLV